MQIPNCPNCGSDSVELIEQSNLLVFYDCDACGHTWDEVIEAPDIDK